MSSRQRIVYQGEPGANSHMACADVFPQWESLPKETFEDALGAITDGSAHLGMIPIENSVAGRVSDIHYLIPDANLHIVGEYFMPLQHQLVGTPDSDLGTIKTVQSHVMALGQCRKVIRSLGLSAVIGADTAGSAREISEAKDASRAAIASRLAAEIYGLKILAHDIADESNNTTRFVILSRQGEWAEQGSERLITSLIFRVRNVPAALYKALGGFATNGVNMTKLESYQLDGQFFATQFYMDIEGHPDDPHVKRALEELAFFSSKLRIIGVYPAHPLRYSAHEAQPTGQLS